MIPALIAGAVIGAMYIDDKQKEHKPKVSTNTEEVDQSDLSAEDLAAIRQQGGNIEDVIWVRNYNSLPPWARGRLAQKDGKLIILGKISDAQRQALETCGAI